MNCPKCNSYIPERGRFCPICRYELKDFERKKLECKSCGGNMEIDYENNIIVCPYCGAKELIINNGKVLLKKKPETPVKQPEIPPARNKKRWQALITLAVIIVVIVLVLCIAFSALSHRDRYAEYEWPTSGVATMIPEPESDYGEIYLSGNEYFSMDVRDYTNNDFLNYVDACREQGFVVDEETGDSYFKAYNEDGYLLNVYCYSSSDEMSIDLRAPVKLSKLTWSYIDAFAYLPEPQSDQGKIEWEYEDSASVYIGNTTKEEYDAYVNACKDAGFRREMMKGEDYYYAYYEEDDQYLSVTYEGFNIMRVDITVNEED